MPERTDDPEVVRAAQRGDPDAFTTLFRRWFDPCVEVARRIVHDEEVAAEVAQDTFLVAWRQLDTLRDPSAFGGWVLRTTRNKALNRLERERRSTAVDQDEHPALTGLDAGVDVAGEVGAAEQQQLLWAASAALGERDASVLDLHLRHGMDAPELADMLGVTPNNAHQLVFRMKGRLAGAIRAWVLYKGGDPTCEELGRVLLAAGITSFSADAVKVIDRHASGCDECSRRRAAILAPEAMFAAVPALPVAQMLREKAASSLRNDGVPLGPDAARPVEAASGPSMAPTSLAPPSTPGPRPVGWSVRRTALVAAAAVLAVALSVGLALLAFGDDNTETASDAETVETTTTTSTASTTTTTESAEAPPSTPEPSVAPPAPIPDPTTTPPAPTGATGSTGSTGSVPPPPPAPAPPQVTSFVATAGQAPAAFCGPGQWPFSLSWSTVDATAVQMVPANGQPVAAGPSGKLRACAPTPGSTWTLVATGPGGTTTASS